MSDTSIATFSGRTLDLADPDPAAICIEDIVAGLSKVCRFGGQSLRFYSVAQHAVAASLTLQRLGRSDLALAALHHDSHEAYTCDVPSPLKVLLNPRYAQITDRLDKAVGEALGVKFPKKQTADRAVIKDADNAILRVEAEALLCNGIAALGLGDEDQPAEPLIRAARAAVGDAENPWPPELSAKNFRRLHDDLVSAD